MATEGAVPNNVTVGLAADGTMQAVYRASSGASTDIFFDITGYFTADSSGSTYHIVSPGRVLDTRPNSSGAKNIGLTGKFKHRVVRSFKVAGAPYVYDGYPACLKTKTCPVLVPAGAAGVTGNLTVTNASTDGRLAIGPTMTSTPSTSTMNIKAGKNRANGVTVQLYNDRLQAVWIGTSTKSTADVIFDVTGYFTDDGSGLKYHPIEPTRMIDSSKNVGISGPFYAAQPKDMYVAGATVVGDGIPVETGAGGISGNLTLISPTSDGYGFISPLKIAAPSSSTLNTTTGVTVANGFDVKLSGSGKVALVFRGQHSYNYANFQMDVTGYWK
jgi:hypothetical protein